MARSYTGSNAIVSLQKGYHGVCSSGLGMVGLNTWRNDAATGQGFHLAPNPDPYRGRFGTPDCRHSMNDESRNESHSCCPSLNLRSSVSSLPVECGACVEYLHDLQQVLSSQVPVGKLAAMMMESIQGVGGTVQFPRDYVRKAAELVRAQNGLIIMDEVQTGFGRTGLNFWGFETHQVLPDIGESFDDGCLALKQILFYRLFVLLATKSFQIMQSRWRKALAMDFLWQRWPVHERSPNHLRNRCISIRSAAIHWLVVSPLPSWT
jgi:4-aminobutyrate aminotransferase-like enzyme